jgi:hypothetical protein
MSILNSILANTIGVGYSAVKGIPDPWTQENLIEEETNNNLQAQGIDPASATEQEIADATAVATHDVTNTIATFKPGEVDCSNIPQGDLIAQAYCGLKKLETVLVVILILGILLYLGGQYAKGKGSK